jgi:hypothetical protein
MEQFRSRKISELKKMKTLKGPTYDGGVVIEDYQFDLRTLDAAIETIKRKYDC